MSDITASDIGAINMAVDYASNFPPKNMTNNEQQIYRQECFELLNVIDEQTDSGSKPERLDLPVEAIPFIKKCIDRIQTMVGQPENDNDPYTKRYKAINTKLDHLLHESEHEKEESEISR